ncbi:hypothetical protein [Streptomyces sp. NPDC021562]|uniref:hypothetical protein n=1 Tax=Streptomyces sp. NPDC021562 TaxID=3155121 RepID=UPI0033DEF9FA
MVSAEPLPELSPPEEDWRSEEEEEDDEVDEVDEDEAEDDEDDELPVPAPESELLDVVPVVLFAVVAASDCTVPTRANTPAAAASVTAADRAAVRRAPRRTTAAAPRSPGRSPC